MRPEEKVHAWSGVHELREHGKDLKGIDVQTPQSSKTTTGAKDNSATEPRACKFRFDLAPLKKQRHLRYLSIFPTQAFDDEQKI